ncbi:MAG: hypothetical protein F4166_07610 [Gammaproteobacteria bacterium]|nr:hypothetical protein [Gammaproteobacteria bacterium]
MHIPENVLQTVGIKGTAATKDNAEKGIAVVQDTAPDIVSGDQKVDVKTSTTATEKIFGAIGAGGKVAKVKGLVIFQCAAAFTKANRGQTIVPDTTTAGKVAFHASNGVGKALYGGNDSGGIGEWVAVIL